MHFFNNPESILVIQNEIHLSLPKILMKIRSWDIYFKQKAQRLVTFREKVVLFLWRKKILLCNTKTTGKNFSSPDLTKKIAAKKNFLHVKNNSSKLVYYRFHVGILVNILSWHEQRKQHAAREPFSHTKHEECFIF